MPAASDYEPAPVVETIAKDLIAKHHPHLASAAISYVFTHKKMTHQGRQAAGKMSRPPKLQVYHHDFDFILIVDWQWWADNGRSKQQKLALIDHELCHGTAKEDAKTGDVKFGIRGHDVEEFAEIIERHQLWTEELRKFHGFAMTNVKKFIETGSGNTDRKDWLETLLVLTADAMGVDLPSDKAPTEKVDTQVDVDPDSQISHLELEEAAA